MKGRDINNKFFQSNNNNKANLKSLLNVCKEGRCNGNLNLSNRSLEEIPMIIFNEKLDDDEKFWEIVPYSKLDLSFNQISNLPIEILSLIELINLKVRNNNLIQLPNGIFRDIQKLNHLDLSFNKIENLDESIGNCICLKELLINNNKLLDIPISIAKCNCLTLLDAQDNLIKRFPNIFFITSITSINLSNNNITEIPEEFSYMISLKSIEIRKNKISHIPSMNKFTQLSYLDLTENLISEVPILPTNNSLQRLHIGFNRLKAIDSLVKVKTLCEVKVNNNMIDNCPNLEGLEFLKMLDLSNNNIQDIHYSLGFLSELLKLIVDGNPIRSIRRTLLNGSTHDLKSFLRTRVKEEVPIGSSKVESSQGNNVKIIVNNKVTHITVENYKYLIENRIRDSENKCVDLSKRKNDSDLSIDDEKIDKYILDCMMKSHYYDQNNHIITIVSLNLEGNLLTTQSLSSVLFQSSLPLLKSLNLRGNQLGNNNTVFRNSASNNYFPSSLLHLDISSNNINDNTLDQFLSGLNLERLYVANNNLTMIPISLKFHNKMKEIDFSMNQLKNTDFEWNHLLLLESVDISTNKIETIEPLINSLLLLSSSNSSSRLPLRTLKLENNNIRDIPVTLGLNIFDNVREIGLHGNPIKSIPFSTIQRGADKVREVLRNRL